MLQFIAKKLKTYDFFNRRAMQLIELKLNMIIDNDPHLLKTLDRHVILSLNRKHSNIPFN